MKDIVWIAVDWGTSNLRVWGVDADGGLVAEAASDKGMAKLDRAGFEPALLDLIGGWLPADRQIPVVACGMVGARQGWLEVPYSATPCRPIFPEAIGRPEPRDPRLRVFVLGGIKQTAPAPDVMRGEETQIAGILSANPSFEGVLCLPGTHTKWVRISAGEIVDFKTFMTGELFSLLSGQSVLRHSLDGAGSNAVEFARSIQLMMTEPASFAGQLFSIRAANLVSGLEPGTARARLSGLLIGAELAAARSYWFDQNPVIVGNGAQSDLYLEGLRTLGRSPRIIDGSGVTLAGLKSAYAQIARSLG
ncbi:MAG: 2-dehydro-3-deoxygalactonokinase [Pseudomonadota bacterium]